MRLVATSDLHGYLPRIPPCDVLVIAGDLMPLDLQDFHDKGLPWLDTQFRAWLEYVPAQCIIGIAGNHDFIFEVQAERIRELNLPWIYLQDSGCEIDGVKFWGLPWVPNLPSWAFHGSSAWLDYVYAEIPPDIDVVLSHGPPQGHLDNRERHFGASQCNAMLKRVKPKVFICGHVHEGYGVKRGYGKHTDLYNVSHCDLAYLPVNKPVGITLD